MLSMLAPLTEAIAAAVTATGDAITAFGEELEAPFHERHMQVMLVTALQTSVATTPLDLSVKPNFTAGFDEWPGVGPVDVSLLDKEGVPAAFLELKWGSNTLYNCIWDLPKMGVALAKQHTRGAYLVAGAPTGEWKNADGAELFHAGDWSVAQLLVKYGKYWKFWKDDVETHPVSLPARIETQPVRAVPTVVRGDEWELRCVEVTAADGNWLNVAEVELGRTDQFH
jgi:hypothetical protein